ncbi:hypothetical protein [Stieleria varia]|uniref:DUF4185 domain-containing protein n=1 Tax=Stieleria varia TaxID=2528005 RepID=A0A5C5ZYY0_9BACT|nr:hypothetical protein [Stieleria varia]TWT91513.1 hypothetical protein Pla52n_66040 [Stieleria varia]
MIHLAKQCLAFRFTAVVFAILSCHVVCGESHLYAEKPFRISIVDESNGWPVPLVELRTTHSVRFISDNAGVIAFDLPELMGVETWFHVVGHGYSVAADGFGYRGVKLTPRPGESAVVKVKRELPAKRLGRITGGGLFAESQKLGEQLDWTEQGILGCDSVQNAIHAGKLYWGWGDTVLPNYPLGRFHMLGATTSLSPLETLQPSIRLRYDYVTDEKGVPDNVAQMPGAGPTWLSGYVSLADAAGQNHLVATYSKIRPPLEEYERGLCQWDEDAERFVKTKTLWSRTQQNRKPLAAPQGHAVLWTDQAGQRWVLFGDPFPSLRCHADLESWSDPNRWQVLTPQRDVPQKGSADTVVPHRGAIAFSKYRKCWITVFTQMGGESSTLGEIWFAESDSPTGPWRDAVKVVTHDKYTFYNPQLHPEFTDPESPILLFEATFTHTFSKTKTPTPRHDYNQVLYRLDLNEF